MSIICMLLGFLAQNLFEWRGGGPLPPPALVAKGVFPEPTQRVRAWALGIVSVLVCLLVSAGVWGQAQWVILAVASALCLNAVMQAVASLVLRRWVPGTLSGLLLMLPGALWVLGAAPLEALAVPAALGIGLSGPVLLAVWWLAAEASR